MIEQAAIEGREICIGFQDLSTCFMSIAKEIQFELEAALGVEPEISAVIKVPRASWGGANPGPAP